MHALPLEFSIRTWHYTQVFRDGDFAIYRQQHFEHAAVIRYEVIKVQIFEERVINGNVTEAGEYYPGSKQWGRIGWTCFGLDEAHALIAELREKKEVDE